MARHGVGGRIWGYLAGLDLKSQSLVIECFSVGTRAVLSTMGEGFGGSRFKVLYGPSFLGSQRKQHVWRNLLQVLARELNHLKQQHKALRQASQLCCFGLQMQFVTVF